MKHTIKLILVFAAMCAAGCMQLTGAKTIDLWGAKFEANTGFDVSAGIQQYDAADNRKMMNPGRMSNKVNSY